MTWEWVTLILGAIFLIVLLFSFVAWTQMHARIVEARPKTFLDMMTPKQKEEQNG